MRERDDLARLLERHPAYSTGNDQQDWFKAQEAANAILAAGWVPEWEYTDLVKRTGALDLEHAHLRAERDALAATVQRVRERLDEPIHDSERSHWLNRWGVGFDAGWAAAMAYVRNSLVAPSDPATDTGGEGHG